MKPWRSEKYRRWIAGHPCLICGNPRTQAAHVTHNGMASKGPDSDIVSACVRHHDEIDGRRKLPNGQVGKRAFEAFYRLDLVRLARMYFEEWKEERKQ